MPSAPLNLAQIADTTNLAIQKMFKKEAKNEPTFKKFYNYRSTEDLYEKDSSLSGLKEAEFTDENAEIFEDVPIQGFDQTYTQESVDILVPYTYKALNFGALAW